MRSRHCHSNSSSHSHGSNSKRCDNRVQIDTNIDVTQNANANGGNGGDGGEIGDTNGEEAIGAVSGNGGDGGNGGTNSLTSTIEVNNVIVINCNSEGEEPGVTDMTLGVNDRTFDITTDGNGNTFVNGKKMEEETFDDGTKVFVIRNADVKKTKA